MITGQAQRWQGNNRIVPAIAALLVNGLIGYALIVGLRGPSSWRDAIDRSPLALFDLQPPAPERPKPPREEKQEGGSPSAPPAASQQKQPAPPRPATVTAPTPVITPPQPILAATLSSSMTNGAGSAGGSDGLGTGQGSGTGGTGTGSGQGDGDGAFSRARQTGGRFRNSDFPASLRGVGRVKIGVRYAIGPSGQVDKCEVIEGSGYAELDAMTCRIIMERYRFRPARDPDGYAVTEVREEDYRWRVR